MAESDMHYNETAFEPEQTQTPMTEIPNQEEAIDNSLTGNVAESPVEPMMMPSGNGMDGINDMNDMNGMNSMNPNMDTGMANNGSIATRTPEWFPAPLDLPMMPDMSTMPGLPGMTPQNFGQVRFLNASANAFPVNIYIDGSAYAINSRFGTISNYDWVSDGFHTVTVRRASVMRSVLLQQNFPFVAGQKVTMVLTDSASGGVELVMVSDTGCSNLPYNSGCYRFANMTYSGSRFDLMLYGGETVFRSVPFQTVTSYKQAAAATYQFYITRSIPYTFLRELPIIVIGAVGTASNIRQPLVSFTADIHAGQNYTTYLIGNNWSDLGLRVITVED